MKTLIAAVCFVFVCFGWLYLSFHMGLGFSYWYLLILYICTALVAYYFCGLHIPSKNRQEFWFISSFISLLILPFVLLIFSFLFIDIVAKVERMNFDKHHSMAKKEGSAFSEIQKFAKDYYNAPLTLGEYDESWALTNLHIPYASPASLRAGTGYCTINVSQPNLKRMYQRSNYQHGYQNWELLIFAHEFAHCLDRASDLPSDLGHNIKGLTSLPPQVRHLVQLDNIHTFLATEYMSETQLWREAYADLFAIGFMSMRMSDVDTLRESLIDYRNAREEDHTHYTSCWLEYSKTQPLPKSAHQLKVWADQIRIAAPCDI